MVVIVVAMGLVLGLALWIIAQAAYPAVRRGEEVLTPEGERLTRDAQQRAREAAARARRAVDVRGGGRGGEAAATPADASPAAGTDDGRGSDDSSGSAPDEDPGEGPDERPDEGGTRSRTVAVDASSQPPRQQNSPVATPATGVSGTIAR